LACRVCTDLVGVSADCASIWRDIERARPEKVSTITNGVDLAAFPFSPRPVGGPPRAVSVARLSSVKDPVTLLLATRRVLDREPGFRLDLVATARCVSRSSSRSFGSASATPFACMARSTMCGRC
jgi:hypothetical protein